MTTPIDQRSPSDEIVAVAERASLYAVLLSALAHQRRPQRLPRALHVDLNVLPSEQPDWHPHVR
ncbi:hypothetical protein [Devosia submarina]|uniref:hypothetical protein n=1 Tax=Devosia submarina TaxID=1173082 RepID=UPI000D34F03D|nr:hypothetical protein [Devosia submarina]